MSGVLLVHGIWDTGKKLRTLARALEAAGLGPVCTVDLVPNDGSAPISALAEQVARAASDLGPGTLDLVGFSMGALVSRYFIQRLRGHDRVRRFVSIAGPHRGTGLARLARGLGTRDMRPGSALLSDLASDRDPWRDVEVHTLWTPYDLMIRPPSSSQLPGSRSDTRIPVAMHRFLITDARALARITAILEAP